MLGYLVYWGGSLLLNEIFGKASVVGSFLAAANSIFREIPFIGDGDLLVHERGLRLRAAGRASSPADYTFWHQLVGGVWIFAVWSFFGQAIHRITSLRIARDEGLSFGEAFAFSAKNWITVILAPIIIALTIAFFYGCNALAGLLISIPFVGPDPRPHPRPAGADLDAAHPADRARRRLRPAADRRRRRLGAQRHASTPSAARSRTSSRVRCSSSGTTSSIFLFVGVILLVGSWFVFVLTKSVDAGVVERPAVDPDRRAGDARTATRTSRSMDKDLQKEIGEPGDRDRATGPAGDARRTSSPSPRTSRRWPSAAVKHGLNAIIFWVILNLIWLGIFGYAIYWFLGATTSVYADLRADVDGTEEDEIYLEEEEEDFDALAEAAAEAERAKAERRQRARGQRRRPRPAAEPRTAKPRTTSRRRTSRRSRRPTDAPTTPPGGGTPLPGRIVRERPRPRAARFVSSGPTGRTVTARRFRPVDSEGIPLPGRTAVRSVRSPPWRPSSAHAGGVRRRATAPCQPEEPSDEAPALLLSALALLAVLLPGHARAGAENPD